jgi:hypothetical protein
MIYPGPYISIGIYRMLHRYTLMSLSQSNRIIDLHRSVTVLLDAMEDQ